MGLLDALKQYIRDASPGGLLNPEVQPGTPTEVAKGLLGFTPGIGDAISGYDAVQSARQGNYGEAALNGLGLLPFVPSMGGVLREVKSMGSLGHQILEDGKVVGTVTQGKAKDAIATYLNQQKAAEEAAQIKKMAAQESAIARGRRKEEVMALTRAKDEYSGLLGAVHQRPNIEFSPLPDGIFGAKDNPLLHQSPSYGKKPGSSYKLVMVDGKPAYAREADHWGEFNTTDWVNGEPVSSIHNWPLSGVDTKSWGDQRRAGYVTLEDLLKQ